ncbi:MAG: OmpA family protein [Paludibacteraceae bacterium]|nr:OmpA family protein [Paludibacteraceae bacterium]
MKRLSTILMAFCCFAVQLSADVTTESRHFLTTEFGAGYSALLNHSSLGKSSGLAGGKLQIGYEWNYRRLLVHTGIEFASVNDRMNVHPFELQTPYTIGLPAGQAMVEHFDFRTWTETQLLGQVNIPVQIGGLFDDRYYFLAGARVGLPVLHRRATTATVHTYLTDPLLIGELGNVPVHNAFTSDETAAGAWAAATVNAQLSAEVGLVLNSFFPQTDAKAKGAGGAQTRTSARRGSDKGGKTILYRIGLFADYGLTSIVRPAPVSPLAVVSEPRNIALNDCFAASGNKVNSLLVGAKFAILFQLNEAKQQKPQKPLPSYIDIFVTDKATAKALPAQVDILDVTKQRTVRREAKSGKVRYRATNAGEYRITAYNESYYPDSQAVTVADGVKERVDLALAEREWLRLRVTNAETHKPVKVTARISDAHTGDSVTVMRTGAKTGVARTRLDRSHTYRLTITRTGYEPYELPIAYIGDSINIALTPLKVGRKVVLHNLFFATGKTQILSQSEQALDELSDFLRDNPTVTIRITGHTDDVGSDKANQILSEGRANAVRNEIVKRGIAAERIEAEGKGESEPIADNATEEGRAKNRRVEFTITATGGALIEQVAQ